jgi:hypothetical protein
VQKFVGKIFEREPHVIFVAVIGENDNVLRSDIEVREGALLYYPKLYVREFVHLAPVIIMGTLEKLKPALGAISSMLVRYEKRVLLFSRCEDMIIVFGLDQNIPTPFSDSMRILIAQAAKESQ